jgi:phospholipase C
MCYRGSVRLACVISAVIFLAGCGASSSPGTSAPRSAAASRATAGTLEHRLTTLYGAPAGVVTHIIIIYQENRTPDNLFQGLPGADIASSGLDSEGNSIQLQPIPLEQHYDVDHAHATFEKMYDGGKMDGANLEGTTCGDSCPYQYPMYGYVPASENQPYMDLAEQYTFGDRMFQSNEGPSYPSHQFIISGTSEPRVDALDLVAEDPVPVNAGAGCKAPTTVSVKLIDAAGKENKSIYPCFEHPTLMDLLDDAGVSWKYYANSATGIWTGPNSIKHILEGPDWKNVILNPSKVLTDISKGNLAQVSWVIPSPLESDHSGATDGSGPSWVASIVNTIGQSSYWDNTTIFITWDDWGGWYDHVPPATFYNSYELGFRVPLIVVSPYANQGYVSHVTHQFGSILKYAEETFGLPSLGYTDALSDDLSDCFNYAAPPNPFKVIPARLNAAYFIRNANAGRDIPEDY